MQHFLNHKTTLAKSTEKCKQHFQMLQESESDKYHSEGNMKMTLIKVNTNKNDSFKHERDTSKNKHAPERYLRKLTEIEV